MIMGQGSSLEVSSPVPTVGNLMVDASDSFVTELKLRSTGIIPISEYIKKEKYKKNVQRLEQVKNAEGSEKTLPRSEINTNKDIEGKEDQEQMSEEIQRRRRRKKGSDFIETSYEDVPENRVWIIKPSRHRTNIQKQKTRSSEISAPDVDDDIDDSDHLIAPQKTIKHTKNKVDTSSNTPAHIPVRTVNKHTITRSDDQPEVEPNKAPPPPEVQELYHRRKHHREEYHHAPPKIKNKKKNAKTSSTDLRKFRQRKDKERPDENNNNNYTANKSTHNVKNHHFHLFQQFPNRNTQNKPKLTVQTNLSCTIPPNKYLIPCLKASSTNQNFKSPNNKLNKITKTVNKNLRFVTPPQSVEKLEISTSTLSLTPDYSYTLNRRQYDPPKQKLSARQALESWKNLHMQKYRERMNACALISPKKLQESRDNATEPLEIDNNYNNNYSSDEIPIFRSSNRPTKDHHYHHHNYKKNSSTIFPWNPRRDKCLQTEGSLRPSKEFIDDIERCLQRHSHLSDLYIKRNGGAKSTWVQDKYRKWHKITFEEN